MKVVCVSASNTKLIGENGTSTKVCNLIGDIIKTEYNSEVVVNIISLANYDLKSCMLCGGCFKSSSCTYNDDFNIIFPQLMEADLLFFVVPHYSPIPSKLLILFEKLNEIAYASWLNNPHYIFPLNGKPTGIIGHGGMPENEGALKYYHDSLITPVANTLRSLSLKVVGLDETYSNGVPFGLKDDQCLKKVDNSIFPEIVQDFDLIKERIKPLVEKVISEIQMNNIKLGG